MCWQLSRVRAKLSLGKVQLPRDLASWDVPHGTHLPPVPPGLWPHGTVDSRRAGFLHEASPFKETDICHPMHGRHCGVPAVITIVWTWTLACSGPWKSVSQGEHDRQPVGWCSTHPACWALWKEALGPWLYHWPTRCPWASAWNWLLSLSAWGPPFCFMQRHGMTFGQVALGLFVCIREN